MMYLKKWNCTQSKTKTCNAVKMMKCNVGELESDVIFVLNRLGHLRDRKTVGRGRSVEESSNLIFTPTISLSCKLY